MNELLHRLSVSLKALLFLLFSGIVAPALAQISYSEQTVTIGEDVFLPYCKGKVIKHFEGERVALMEKIYQVIASWDSLNPPRGFEASFNAGDRDLDLTFAAYVKEGESKTTNSGALLSVCVNDPARAFGSPVINNIFLQPEKVADFFGYPVYQNTDQEVTVISKNKSPLFVPVTQEEYLQQLIKTETEKQKKEPGSQQKSDSEVILAEMEKTYKELLKTDTDAAAEFKIEIQKFKAGMNENQNDDVPADLLTLLKKELENLSPVERSKPAWYSIGAIEKYGNFSGLVPESNAEEGTALVKIAPVYASLANNKNAIKLLVISWKAGYDNSNSDKPRYFDDEAKGFLLADYYMVRLYHQQKIWNNIINLVQ